MMHASLGLEKDKCVCGVRVGKHLAIAAINPAEERGQRRAAGIKKGQVTERRKTPAEAFIPSPKQTEFVCLLACFCLLMPWLIRSKRAE